MDVVGPGSGSQARNDDAPKVQPPDSRHNSNPEIATTDRGPLHSVTDALQEFVDSHPDKIALVDENWTILAISQDWAEEAAAHGYADYRRGGDYLKILKRGVSEGDLDAAVIFSAVQQVASGKRRLLQYVYTPSGISDHEVARRVLGQVRHHRLDHGQHHGLRLAHRQAADGVAVEAHARPAPWRCRRAAPRRRRPGRCRTGPGRARCGRAGSRTRASSARPSAATEAWPADLGFRTGQAHAFVELHLDVGAEQPLDLDRAFRRQVVASAVDMRLERHARLVEACAAWPAT